MWGAGSGWISRLLGGGKIRVTEIHQERNPYFGGVNPEPIRPNIDEALGMLAGGGYDLGLLLDGDADRAGAADERGTFIHQLQVTGLLMYYLAEHRGLRDPVVISVNNTSMAARLGEHYGIKVYETPVGFKYIGPKMIETGAMMGAEESGGFGFGMHLPERDGIYADLMLLDLFLREKAAGRWPVSKAIEHFHSIAGASFYQRVDVHIERNLYAETKRRLLVDLREQAPAELAGQAGDADHPARHERRVQVLRRRRLVAARPHVRDRAARARLRGGDLRRHPRRDAGRRREAGPRVTDADGIGRRVEKPWGHELIWAHTDRYVGKVLVIETGEAALAPAPRDQGRVDPGPVGPAPAVPRGRRGDRPGPGARPRESCRVATGRIHRYEAIERCELIEVSTPELDDVVRIEDDFGREGTNAP